MSRLDSGNQRSWFGNCAATTTSFLLTVTVKSLIFVCISMIMCAIVCERERESERVLVNENCLICLQGKWEQEWIYRCKKKSRGGVRVHEAWCNFNQQTREGNFSFLNFFLIYKNYFKFIYYFKLSFKFQ